MTDWQELTGLPWPVAKRYLEEAGQSYRLIDSLAPKVVKPTPPGLVTRVRQRSACLEIVLVYPVFEPNSPDLLTSRRPDVPGET